MDETTVEDHILILIRTDHLTRTTVHLNNNQASTSNPFRTSSHRLNNIEENPQPNPNFQKPASGGQLGT